MNELHVCKELVSKIVYVNLEQFTNQLHIYTLNLLEVSFLAVLVAVFIAIIHCAFSKCPFFNPQITF